jgi:hypothetical protein
MKTLVACEVCGYSNPPEIIRCSRCAWEIRGPEFFGSLTDLETERYLERRDLVRARWEEMHKYDQTPLRGSYPAEWSIIRGAGTTPDNLAIGSGLL